MPGVGCSRQILILAAFIFLPSCATTEENSIKVVDVLVSDFGAVPNDGENDLPGLRAALEFCRSKTGVRLYLAPGRYDIRDEKAVELMESVMRGEKGNNPQDAIYRPYFDYVRGLDFSSLEDLVVEAVGAELIVDGWMEPVALENCTNITIRGLTIDYKRPPYSIGTVVNVWDGYFDVKYGSEYPLNRHADSQGYSVGPGGRSNGGKRVLLSGEKTAHSAPDAPAFRRRSHKRAEPAGTLQPQFSFSTRRFHSPGGKRSTPSREWE